LVKIVTDSTASIPPELCTLLDITVVPIPIQFGAETFLDGVEPVRSYYERLGAVAEPPSTSTPSPGTFVDVYQRLAGETVISIHVMGTKSVLVNVARLAASMLPDRRIHVVDSETTTLGLGLLVIAAARAALQGQPAEAIVAWLDRQVPRVAVFAAIPQLTQLRRSGRISLGKAVLAGVLSIKPILYLGQGVADVVDKARGWETAVERMVQLAWEKAGGARVALAVVHTDAEAAAKALLAQIQSRFHCMETMVAEAGPTLAAHAGPGALGVVTLPLD
jgi:DegV family protein with EDD domain